MPFEKNVTKPKLTNKQKIKGKKKKREKTPTQTKPAALKKLDAVISLHINH